MGNSALPIGWEVTNLNSVVTFQNGFAFKSSSYVEDGHFLIRIGNVQDRKIDLNKPVYINVKSDKELAFVLNTGDILMSLTGNIGKVGIISDSQLPAVLNQRVARILPISGNAIDKVFLYYALQNPVFIEYLYSVAKGAAQLNVSGKDILQSNIWLPPVNEQTRIAKKLDELLAQVETIKTRIDAIPNILKRFRQSVLNAAVTGRLTDEWRVMNPDTSSTSLEVRQFDSLNVDKKAIKLAAKEFLADEILFDIPKSWAWHRLCRISEVVSGVAKGSKTKKKVVELPYLRVANVQRGYLDLTEIKLISVPEDKVEKLTLMQGDILFNEGGDLDKLGRGWVWEDQIDSCIHQNHVFRARLFNPKFEPKFFSYYGNSAGKNYFIRAGSQTVNLANINKTSLSLLPVPVPPAEEQKEIINQVEKLFSFADQIEKSVSEAQARIDKLTQSILAKAFRGELVPQDPNDEPASELLKRIKAEREKAEQLAKAAKKIKRKS